MKESCGWQWNKAGGKSSLRKAAARRGGGGWRSSRGRGQDTLWGLEQTKDGHRAAYSRRGKSGRRTRGGGLGCRPRGGGGNHTRVGAKARGPGLTEPLPAPAASTSGRLGVRGLPPMIALNFQQAWGRRAAHTEKLRPGEVTLQAQGHSLGTHSLLLSLCFPLFIRLWKAWKKLSLSGARK